jgi:hypothetical protein
VSKLAARHDDLHKSMGKVNQSATFFHNTIKTVRFPAPITGARFPAQAALSEVSRASRAVP